MEGAPAAERVAGLVAASAGQDGFDEVDQAIVAFLDLVCCVPGFADLARQAVEFRLEEDAFMDVVLRGTYEIHRSFGDLALAKYLVRVENADTGAVEYLKSARYAAPGAGPINVMDGTMLPAGDYLLVIETLSKCRKGGFASRSRRDASIHLSPSISFSN